MDNKFDFMESLKIAGIICGYLIGSGFSSGQELLQYYTSYGLWGLAGAGVACVTLCIMAVWLLTLGKRANIENPHEVFKYYCGEKVGYIFEFIAFAYLIIQVVVFFTGAGATISQAFNVSVFAGSAILGVLVIFTVLLGLHRLAIIMGNVGILLIIIVVSVSTIFLLKSSGSISEGHNLALSMDILQPSESWFLAGFLYETFNLLGLAAFLPMLGAKSKSQTNNIVGGLLGPVLISLTICLVNLAFLKDISNIAVLQVPMLSLAENVFPILGTVFSLVILAAVYSGASPMYWNFCTRIIPESDKKFKPFVFALGIAVIILGALLPFDRAINIVYLLYGYLGTAFFAFVIYKEVTRRRKNEL